MTLRGITEVEDILLLSHAKELVTREMYTTAARQDFQRSSGIVVDIAFHQQFPQLHL